MVRGQKTEDRRQSFCCGMAALSFRKCRVAARNPQPSVSSHPSSGSGFTLIELLVVMVVIGVALGMVMVQLMPDQQAPLREESARLALLLENAGMEARASGRSLAWSGANNQYRFLSKNKYGDWVRIEDISEFRQRILPEGINVTEVSVEEQPLKPGEHLLLSAHTFAVPFRIRLTNSSGKEINSAYVTGKSTGDVAYALVDQAAELDVVKPLPASP